MKVKHMSRLTTKGQITVPKDFRDALGWRTGDQVAFVKDRDGVRITRARPLTRGDQVIAAMKQVKGLIPGMTTDMILRMTREDR